LLLVIIMLQLEWHLTAPIFIEDRLDEELDTSQITLDGMTELVPFAPKTKFRLERYVEKDHSDTPTRLKTDLFDYFKHFKERDCVQTVVMDMWEAYRDLSKFFFKNAMIVAYKYHFVRQVIVLWTKYANDYKKKYPKIRD